MSDPSNLTPGNLVTPAAPAVSSAAVAPAIVPTKLDSILSDLDLALQVAMGFGGVLNPAAPAVASLLDKLLHAGQSIVATHEQISGKKLDPSLLKRWVPLP